MFAHFGPESTQSFRVGRRSIDGFGGRAVPRGPELLDAVVNDRIDFVKYNVVAHRPGREAGRESEKRENRKPQLSDLRDSGCLVGSSPVFLPDQGSTKPIAELVGQSGFNVLSLDTEAMGTISLIEHAPTVLQTAYGVFSDLVTIVRQKKHMEPA